MNQDAMNGWMTCDYTSLSTVYESYQDDGRVTMKCLVQRQIFAYMDRALDFYISEPALNPLNYKGSIEIQRSILKVYKDTQFRTESFFIRNCILKVYHDTKKNTERVSRYEVVD